MATNKKTNDDKRWPGGKDHSLTTSGNANWFNHYMKQYKDSSKNLESFSPISICLRGHKNK